MCAAAETRRLVALSTLMMAMAASMAAAQSCIPNQNGCRCCSGPTACNVCTNGLSPIKNRCVRPTACAAGVNNCTKCGTPARTGPAQCVQCGNGTSLLAGLCIAPADVPSWRWCTVGQNNCATCNGVLCASCLDGSAPVNGLCRPAPSCTNNCQGSCFPSPSSCNWDGSCLMCVPPPPGRWYSIISGACTLCPMNCVACTSTQVCTKCVPGYDLRNGACATCAPGYRTQQLPYKCVACAAGCATCQTTRTGGEDCTSCKPGFVSRADIKNSVRYCAKQ